MFAKNACQSQVLWTKERQTHLGALLVWGTLAFCFIWLPRTSLLYILCLSLRGIPELIASRCKRAPKLQRVFHIPPIDCEISNEKWDEVVWVKNHPFLLVPKHPQQHGLQWLRFYSFCLFWRSACRSDKMRGIAISFSPFYSSFSLSTSLQLC